MAGDNSDSPTSRFGLTQLARAGGPFALEAAFRQDTAEMKTNLVIGAYRDDDAQPWVLSAVKQARDQVIAGDWLHEYLPLVGDEAFIEASKKLLFGPGAAPETIASVQTVSGSGANSLIAQLATEDPKSKQVWLPDPTWDNHYTIWQHHAPGLGQRKYPYYNTSSLRFDFEGMMYALRSGAQPGDVILLHACAHNPTGLDPTQTQWREIASVCYDKKLFVVFDVAYQGLASGDLDQDAWAIRHFYERGDIDLAACQSYSKNMGLYGERVGVLHVVPLQDPSADSKRVLSVRSRMIELQRASVSMAPRFGSSVASVILGDEALLRTWKADLASMSGRIKQMRELLHAELVKLGTPGNWAHIAKQTGMFSYTGLSASDVGELQKIHHVYLLPSGRASVCGLNRRNVKYVARAIHQVIMGRT